MQVTITPALPFEGLPSVWALHTFSTFQSIVVYFNNLLAICHIKMWHALATRLQYRRV